MTPTRHSNIVISVDLVRAAERIKGGFFAGKSGRSIEEAFRRYCKFLELVRLYPEEELAPTRDIDEMWHLHMLHPVAYVRDCEQNFGEILDHDGGFGSDSEEEWTSLVEIFNRTEQLWFDVFGEPYRTSPGDTSEITKCVRACRVACKKGTTRPMEVPSPRPNV